MKLVQSDFVGSPIIKPDRLKFKILKFWNTTGDDRPLTASTPLIWLPLPPPITVAPRHNGARTLCRAPPPLPKPRDVISSNGLMTI
jgi:hypothetical protein